LLYSLAEKNTKSEYFQCGRDNFISFLSTLRF